MEKEKKVRIKKFKMIATGFDMIELIEFVKKKFKDEYNFEPDNIKITNLIAQRVKENKLF